MDLYNSCLIVLLLAETGVFTAAQLVMPSHLSGVRGRNLNFTASGPPETEVQTVTWTFIPKKGASVPVCTATTQNEKVSEAYKGRVKYYRSTYTLELNSLTPFDSGVYALTIVDAKLDQLVGQTELEVLEPVADVQILSNVSEAVEINSTVALTCSAKGSSLSFVWLNNSAPVVLDGKHVVVNGSELIIKEVYRSDLRGPITCTAKNQLESLTSTAFNLTVNYGPDPVSLKREPAAEFLKKGSNLTLSCSTAGSSPAAEFIWRYNDIKLPQSTAVLSILNLEEKHSGNYSCMAYNSKTLRYVYSEVAKLSVIEAISETKISAPTEPLIAGNSTATLTCASGAGKADSVQWHKDGKPLETSNRIVYTKDNRTVTILPVQKGDTGEYKCQLKNKINNDTSNYSLTVNYGPDDMSIKGDKQALVGHTVMLDCSFASFPVPLFLWKFNDSILRGETNKCLTIVNFESKDSGIYTCEAFNNVTNLTKTATHNLAVMDSDAQSQDGLSSGAIAGIIIAVLVLLAIVIGVCIHRKRKVSDIPSPY